MITFTAARARTAAAAAAAVQHLFIADRWTVTSRLECGFSRALDT